VSPGLFREELGLREGEVLGGNVFSHSTQAPMYVVFVDEEESYGYDSEVVI
jgi:hypothetical protein